VLGTSLASRSSPMVIDNLLYYTLKTIPFATWALERVPSIRIIYYHHVNVTGADYYFNSGISLDTFKRQICYLRSAYQIIPLTEAISRSQSGDGLGGYLSITFDDGFAECYDYVFPHLQELGLSATFFLIGNALNNNDLMWRHKLLVIQNTASLHKKQAMLDNFREEFGVASDESRSLLEMSDSWPMAQKERMVNFLWDRAGIGSLREYLDKHKPYLTDKQVFEMLENNQEIGSHTKSHPFCGSLSFDELQTEVVESVQNLNKRFGVNINSISYPFGDRPNREAEAYISDKTGITTLLGIADNFGNHSDTKRWERINMEKNYNQSFSVFYVKPLLTKLLNV